MRQNNSVLLANVMLFVKLTKFDISKKRVIQLVKRIGYKETLYEKQY